MRIDDASSEAQFVAGEPERLAGGGGVGDEHSGLAVTPAGVEHQVGRERDVRSLLLCFDYFHGPGSRSRRTGEIGPCRADVEDTEVYRNRRKGGKCAQVRLLSDRKLRVALPRADLRGEVTDPVDLVLREQVPTQGVEVEPFIRSPFERAVEEVEAIDIHIGPGHGVPPAMCSRGRVHPAGASAGAGGMPAVLGVAQPARHRGHAVSSPTTRPQPTYPPNARPR